MTRTPSESGDDAFPWAGEALSLVTAAQAWLAEAADGAHGGLDTGAPACGVCPLCRAVGAIRGADPAVLAAGVDVVTTVAVGIADVLKRAADDLVALLPDRAAESSPLDDDGGPVGPADRASADPGPDGTPREATA